jgi:hypothetical protein
VALEIQKYLENDAKVYVDVNVDHRADGTILPRSIIWEDGRRFEVDKVIDVRPAASLKAGGCGLRYTVRVRNKETFMFFEEYHGVGRWFIEKK